MLSTDRVGTILSATNLNGHSKFAIRNSSLETESTTLDVTTNDTRLLDISIEKSAINSRNYISNIRESNAVRGERLIQLNVSDSWLRSSGSYGIYISSCYSQVDIFLKGSNFITDRYDNTLRVQSSYMNITATENIFSDTDRALDFQFCDFTEFERNISRSFIISQNIFNSSYIGEDIYFYKYYTEESNHTIEIKHNTFDHGWNNRRGIVLEGRYYSQKNFHNLSISSNVFRNMTGSVIQINFPLERIHIQDNVFLSNMQCIYLTGSSSQLISDGLEVDQNIFNNNTHSEGIVLIDRTQLGRYYTNITLNTFINNSGIVLTLRFQNTSIRYNIFENENAIYNVKSLSSSDTISKTVNASLNYWGTTNVREIAKIIYDAEYDVNLMDVIFRPYLGSKNLSDVQNEDVGFLTGNEIGGQVNGNVTLILSGSPYLAVSNIEISENDTLTIEAGVVIYLKGDIGISVIGGFI